MILISACLLGIPCRYDGSSCPSSMLHDLAAHGRVLPICPEVTGGLPIPRLPAEIEGAHAGLDGESVLEARARVVRSDGVDVTAQFVAGAEEALVLARRFDIQQAILKADSPSCGVGCIYDGMFRGRLVPGDGVTTALLKRAGIRASTENDL